MPTFDEVIELALELGNQLGRPIGVYPESKHPTYFRSISLPLEDRILASFDRHGWSKPTAPVFIQSFETNLRELRPKTPLKLIQLIEGKVPTDADLRTIKSYADGIGPNTRLVISAVTDGTLFPPTDLVARAHAAGLLVRPLAFVPRGHRCGVSAVRLARCGRDLHGLPRRRVAGAQAKPGIFRSLTRSRLGRPINVRLPPPRTSYR